MIVKRYSNWCHFIEKNIIQVFIWNFKENRYKEETKIVLKYLYVYKLSYSLNTF